MRNFGIKSATRPAASGAQPLPASRISAGVGANTVIRLADRHPSRIDQSDLAAASQRSPFLPPDPDDREFAAYMFLIAFVVIPSIFFGAVYIMLVH